MMLEFQQAESDPQRTLTLKIHDDSERMTIAVMARLDLVIRLTHYEYKESQYLEL